VYYTKTIGVSKIYLSHIILKGPPYYLTKVMLGNDLAYPTSSELDTCAGQGNLYEGNP
jgi:hypothetical protein